MDENQDFEITKKQVFEAARAIPKGRVTSYGALGKACNPPISGYVCGRIMGVVTDDVPWWRVVGKEGNLPIRKRHPELEAKQRRLLSEEGIQFDENGQIQSRFFLDDPLTDATDQTSLFTE